MQRLQRSLQVCGRVGVGTDNRDFGEGNFAEIANAGAFLQANVHEDASGAHRPASAAFSGAQRVKMSDCMRLLCVDTAPVLD
ncbi:MAG: hypothetical protein OSA37_08910 [Flavobacteriales bacterium]|nr:hypothetical protein [Flavobacteriales bacterium]